MLPSVLLPLAKGHQKSHPSSRTSINFDNARSKIIIMSRHQDHPLRIHLVPPTGTRNWQEAIAFTCAMLVGCTFLDRRDAAGALVAHAVIFSAVINFAVPVPLTVRGSGALLSP